MKGTLYLIPSPLGENDLAEVLPDAVLERARSIGTFVVEEVRTARRYLSKAGLKGHIDELRFFTLNEHTAPGEVEELLGLFDEGDVGLISEAGLPAVADPGAQLVALCHSRDIRVVPLVGPSSLMLALMASGLNGQSFAFCGYLPAKPEERRKAIRAAEKRSAELSQTQIFIETPYRNDALLADMLQILSPTTQLCVAADITLPTQFIQTKTVAQWRKYYHPEHSEGSPIGKRPCVFILLA